jgi:hypothetical protein
MIDGIADELRAFAQRLARTACGCSDRKLSHALEELAIDLAARAAELDRLLER